MKDKETIIQRMKDINHLLTHVGFTAKEREEMIIELKILLWVVS